MKFKHILYPSILTLVFTSCQSKMENSNEAILPEKSVIQNTEKSKSSDSICVDAYTAATARHNSVSLNGIIINPPQNDATIALTMGGIVRRIELLPGQYIQKGSIIATLENPEFIDLQQNYLENSAQMVYLKEEYNRQKTLSEQKAASLKKFQECEAEYKTMQTKLAADEARLSLLGMNGKQLETDGIKSLLEVKAPISGYVSEININRGKYVQAGNHICKIIDKSSPLLCLTTYEKDLAEIKNGDQIKFRVNGMSNETFEAVIISIDQQVDEVNRSIKVYARILQSHLQFRPGMYVTAQINN